MRRDHTHGGDVGVGSRTRVHPSISAAAAVAGWRLSRGYAPRQGLVILCSLSWKNHIRRL